MTERSESERAEEDRIDRLRLAAFKSNDASDRQSYFDATSKWFQDRHYRRMATLSKPAPVAADASAEAREDMADWSDLPKDIYVVGARRVNAVGFDVQCCSVPMVTAPEVRYVRSDMIAVSETSTQSSANASAVLQNDLGEMLLALGMSDAAQPKSPHDVFQSALAEMKSQIANASAEARLREALEPFIKHYEPWMERLSDEDQMHVFSRHTMGDLRRAREALSQHPHASDCDKQGER